MLRRNFLSLSALVGLSTITPISLQAIDFRQTKVDVWSANTVDDAIRAMYGTTQTINTGVTITTPSTATRSASVPLNIKSDLQAKSVAIFQDANPEAAVAVFTIHGNTIIDYDLKIKLQSDGTPITITAIVEGEDGKLYSSTKILQVALGTCDG
ncbi:thiosulfate oxidation carrier protein SoxY [Sulfurimonas sp. MAG313]|nr:thiosulfate oxidation carrier protein SoxY [Sulfurimonas sp. MAG313]MDF1881768.1 thiosulfate oxidation carrier protein SoxY [Sulfurimonas sp. MAG313]